MHIAWEYPPLVYGGLGRHVHALTMAQVAAGHEVMVITDHHDEAPMDTVVDGVRVIREGSRPALPFEPEFLMRIVTALDDSLAASAARHLRDFDPEIIHCHDWMTTRAGISASAVADVPLVATIHATEWGRHQGYLSSEISRTVDSVERYLAQTANGLIVCSSAMRSEISSQFGVAPGRVTVIPNGVDTSVWRTTEGDIARARSRWAPHGPLLTYSGRLEAEKGIFTMLDAMPQVLNEHPAARLVVAGSGGQSQYFDHDVAARGLAGSVVRSGWLPEADLRALVGSSDAALIPSLYEPFGLVALEAMSLGAPVVCARTGGLVDIVVDGVTGLLFDPGSPSSLAHAINRTLSDPQAARQRAEAAHEPLRERFSWPSIAESTVVEYRSIIDTDARARREATG